MVIPSILLLVSTVATSVYSTSPKIAAEERNERALDFSNCQEMNFELDDDAIWDSELKIRNALDIRGGLPEEGLDASEIRIKEKHKKSNLVRRATSKDSSKEASSTSSASVSSTAVVTTTTGSSQGSSSASSTSTSSSAAASLTAFPQPFDEILSTNFTSSTCPEFFQTFLADPDFESCHPISLLLPTSESFFTDEQSPSTLLVQVLDAACSATPGEEFCVDLMGRYATEIVSDANCGKDIGEGNALAITALQGFRSYQVTREATCAIDNSTGAYCFEEAVAASNPSDIYFYYLPQGTSLPSNTKPTCDACTANLLAIYSTYATNTSLDLSSVFTSARNLAAASCGPTYAPSVATTASTSGSSFGSSISSSIFLIWLSLMLSFGF